MKSYRSIIALVVMAGVLFVCPQPGVMLSSAYAKDATAKDKIIADTLAAHRIICLSRNGLIETVFIDGKWVSVQGVEIVNRTLILRTDLGNISLAAVIK